MVKSTSYVLGIDVGTNSVRASLFNAEGVTISRASSPIPTYNPKTDYYEQSTADIWAACKESIQNTVAKASNHLSDDTLANSIVGITFDATCSLVIEAGNNSIDSSGRDVILWMDHRAVEEAREINESQHALLRSVGGSISPEMEIPKLKWLKKIPP
eukprot:gb/GECG01015776.1/.p1 GENE.gb/GECG01015776.1/~~gb/GECG01015776.1/.p1  ORF type:complete len:157 (+),score=15.99 gb/GECG01015776.1/:1-471(+)